MPDPTNPTDQSQMGPQPAPTIPEPTVTAVPPFPGNDAPTPMPADAGAPIPPEPGPIEGAIPGDTDSGSAAPGFDIPPVVTPAPSKKGGGKRVIATILGLLLLVGGVGAGVVLVRQQQDIREKASMTEPCKICSNNRCIDSGLSRQECSPSFNECSNDVDCGGTTPECTANTITTCLTTRNCPGKKQCQSNGYWGSCNDIADNCPAEGQQTGTLQSCPNTDCNLPTTPEGAVRCLLNNSESTCCPIDRPLYDVESATCIATAGSGGNGTGTTRTSCTTAPTGGGTCRHTDGTTASFTGGCVIIYCPNGLGSDGRCNLDDSGAWQRFGSCSSLWNSLGDGQCGQIDTVDAENVYCAASCDSKIVNRADCSNTPRQDGGSPTAQCLNVKAYDTDWNLLTTEQLSSLFVGDSIRLTVSGTATSGSFDKARFKINGAQRPEVTQKKPGTEEYYDEYTIPEGLTSFTIGAQIHHATLGWSE